ncbi:polysaccharide biosynthesis/export family protein [Microbulbifer agarilyticus]
MKNKNFSGLVIALIVTIFTVVPSALVSAETVTYRMNAGDRISIRVFGESDLSQDFMLSESGVVNYPFLGELQVSGLTPIELENVILQGLKGDYLISPSVTVAVIEYRPVFIYGEVQAPGGYNYQPGLTVGKAAALAQGITERGSENRIYLTREGATDDQRVRANMSTKLQPGDVITIEQGFF